MITVQFSLTCSGFYIINDAITTTLWSQLLYTTLLKRFNRKYQHRQWNV